MNYKTSFSARLRIKLQLAYGSKEGKNTTLPSGQNAPAWFRDYLIVTHSIIRSSVPLMQARLWAMLRLIRGRKTHD